MNRKIRRTAAKQLRSADVKGTDDATLQVLVDQAVSLAQSGKWPDAEKILRHLLAAAPEHPEALHMMGMVYGSTGRSNEGIELLKRATVLNPGEALYWGNLSTCYLAAYHPAEAAEAARRAVALEPGYVIAWNCLGNALTEVKDYATALEAYERVRALSGSDLGNTKHLANCQMNLGQLEQAETTLRLACGMAPDDAEILANLGAVLVARQKFPEAVSCLERAIEQEPGKFSVALHYARALIGVNETDKAIRWLRKASSMDHRSVEAWLLLGETMLSSGDAVEAKIAAKRAVELAPGDLAAQDLRRRVDQLTSAAKPTIQKPAMWDFHLGDDSLVRPASGNGLDVTFGKPEVGGTMGLDAAGMKNPAAEKKAVAKPEPASEPATGIVDLTVLKIG
jgi:predicted Zn-dependent protease